MNPKQLTRRSFAGTSVAAIAAYGIGGLVGGCKTKVADPQPQADQATSAPQASSVPLRVFVISSITEPDTIVRQWRALSDQPIDLISQSVEEFLRADKCLADILLYPSRLIGELVKRQWVAKLPKALADLTKIDPAKHDEESQFAVIPAGMVSAGVYGSTAYGLPLGYSMVSLLGSKTTAAEKLTWNELDSMLGQTERKAIEFDDAQVDPDALVDRFLSLAFAATEVNSNFGVLFELRTMKARLSADEFVLAATTLQRMAMQPQAAHSVIASHTAAWRWVNEATHPAVALVSASQIDLDALNLDGAKPITVDSAKVWNNGAGILASITMNCRQTAQSTKFVQWLAQQKSLENLRGQVPGLISPLSRGQTLADKVVSSNQLALQHDSTCCEPRCAGVSQLRSILATNLKLLLRGGKNVEAALSETAAEWNSIIKQSSSNPKADYERSLALRD